MSTWTEPTATFDAQFWAMQNEQLTEDAEARATAPAVRVITSGQSVASIDKAGTLSGGTYLFNLSIASGSNVVLDLTPFHSFLAPGEIMGWTGTASANSQLGVSVNWTEDQ